MRSRRIDVNSNDPHAVARAVLAPLGIGTPEDLRDSIADIAEYKRATVRRTPMDGLSGRLIGTSAGSIITVNSNESEERQRFSIAHELGHHEMHRGVNQTFACTSRDMKDYKQSLVERQANSFASYLLMPDSLFTDAVDDRPPSVGVAREIAPRFGTSLTATALRFIEITDERAAVVVSGVNGVRWAVANEQFGFDIDKRLPRLSRQSYAYDVLHGAPAQHAASQVDGDTWLHFDLFPGNVLLESSMRLGNMDVALTVLWIREDVGLDEDTDSEEPSD